MLVRLLPFEAHRAKGPTSAKISVTGKSACGTNRGQKTAEERAQKLLQSALLNLKPVRRLRLSQHFNEAAHRKPCVEKMTRKSCPSEEGGLLDAFRWLDVRLVGVSCMAGQVFASQGVVAILAQDKLILSSLPEWSLRCSFVDIFEFRNIQVSASAKRDIFAFSAISHA